MEKEERIIRYTLKVPVSMDKKIRAVMKEKGFASKQDFITNAVEVYMDRDVSPTSDRAYIPKSRITAQYQNMVDLMDGLAKKEAQMQMIGVLTFEVLFHLTRFSKTRLSKEEMDRVLLDAAKLSDSENGVNSTALQRLIYEIIKDDKSLKSGSGGNPISGNTGSSSMQMKNQVCRDAWMQFLKEEHTPEERKTLIKEIGLLESLETDAGMKKLYEKARMSSSDKAAEFLAGVQAVESDLYFRAYGKRRMHEDGLRTDVHSFVEKWTDEKGRLKGLVW